MNNIEEIKRTLSFLKVEKQEQKKALETAALIKQELESQIIRRL